MMEAFSAYIKNIAAFTVFAAFAEMLMPENSLKKYSSLVLGILLVTALVKPMFLLLEKGSEGFVLEERILESSSDIAQTDGAAWQQDMVLAVYQRDLEETIGAALEEKFQKDVTVTAEVAAEEETYGQIVSVTITGDTTQGEEMKAYMEKTYEIPEDAIYIEGS